MYKNFSIIPLDKGIELFISRYPEIPKNRLLAAIEGIISSKQAYAYLEKTKLKEEIFTCIEYKEYPLLVVPDIHNKGFACSPLFGFGDLKVTRDYSKLGNINLGWTIPVARKDQSEDFKSFLSNRGLQKRFSYLFGEKSKEVFYRVVVTDKIDFNFNFNSYIESKTSLLDKIEDTCSLIEWLGADISMLSNKWSDFKIQAIDKIENKIIGEMGLDKYGDRTNCGFIWADRNEKYKKYGLIIHMCLSVCSWAFFEDSSINEVNYGINLTSLGDYKSMFVDTQEPINTLPVFNSFEHLDKLLA